MHSKYILPLILVFALAVPASATFRIANPQMQFHTTGGAIINFSDTTTLDAIQWGGTYLNATVSGSKIGYSGSSANTVLSSLSYQASPERLSFNAGATSGTLNIDADMAQGSKDYVMFVDNAQHSFKTTDSAGKATFPYSTWGGIVKGFIINLTSIPSISVLGEDYQVVDSGESVQLGVTTAGAGTTYNWTVDGVGVINNQGTYTNSWTYSSIAGNLHRVLANVTNSEGVSNTLEWRIVVLRTLAATPVATLNETAYDNVETAVRSYDFLSFMGAVVGGYTDVVGNVFYLFLWLTIFGMYWLRQKSVTIPVVLGLIMGSALIMMLPEEYQSYSVAVIGFGGFCLLYLVFTERRQ